jgi:hypothetical protein
MAMDPAAKIVLVSDYDDAARRESASAQGHVVMCSKTTCSKYLLRITKGDKA